MVGRPVTLALLAIAFLTIPSLAPTAPLFFSPLRDASLPIDRIDGVVSIGQEPDIVVDKFGTWIWIGDTSGVYRSDDGGASWSKSIPAHLPGLFTDGIALAQDDAGTLYASSTNGQMIYVSRSTNGGLTWTSNMVAMVDLIADRPWLIAKGTGQVALIYNGNGQHERCMYSTDGGQTFLSNQLIAPAPNAGNGVFDSLGRIYYTINGRVVRFPAACAGSATSMGVVSGGAQIMRQMAVYGSNPDIYYAEPTMGNGEMVLRGYHGILQTTLKTIVLNPDEYNSSTFAAMDIRDDGDEIVVAYYASTTPGNPSLPSYPSTASWDVLVTRVSGFWSATPTVTTSVVATGNHVGGFCMNGIGCTGGSADRDLLDYMGVEYGPDGRVHLAYGHDGATSSPTVRYATLAP